MNRRHFLGSLLALLASTRIKPAEAGLVREMPEYLGEEVSDVLFRLNLGSAPPRGTVWFSAWLREGSDGMWTRVGKQIILDGSTEVVEITRADFNVGFKAELGDHGLEKEAQGRVFMAYPSVEFGSPATAYIPTQSNRASRRKPRKRAKSWGPPHIRNWWEA